MIFFEVAWVLFLAKVYSSFAEGNVTCCSAGRAAAGARFRTRRDTMLMMIHPHKGGGTSLCDLLKRDPQIRFGRGTNCNVLVPTFDVAPGTRWSPRTEPVLGVHWWPQNVSPEVLASVLKKSGRNAMGLEVYSMPASFHLDQADYFNNEEMRRWAYVTIMRHPVDRIISHYFFASLPKRFPTILNWTHELPYYTQNYHTRIFSSQPKPTNPEQWHSVPTMNRIHYTQARDTLSHLSAVLVLERFNAGVPLLRKYLGLNIPGVPPHKNKAHSKVPTKKRITEEEYDELLRLNKLDMDLYRHAVAIHDCALQNLEYTEKAGKQPGAC